MDHPYLDELLKTGKYVLLRPYEPVEKGPKFTSGILMTVDGGIRPTPPALVSTTEELESSGVSELIALYYLGDRLSGHNGIVHGGLLATLLDEALCRCGFALLPHHVGVTANLSINYKLPTPTNSYLVLKARTTKVEGRKVWVHGDTFVIPPPSDYVPGEQYPNTMEAELLAIEPKWWERLVGGAATRLHEERKAASEALARDEANDPEPQEEPAVLVQA